jgi:hypothetical protein
MTMAYVSIAVTVIGASVSAYGQYESGQSQKKAAEYNATMQNRAADDAMQRGAIDAAAVKERTRKLISTQIANSGAAGFDSGTGTALDLSTEAAGFGELDALKTINNSQRVASGQQAQANLDLFQGSSAARTGTLNAAGTLFSGAGNAGRSYYSVKTGRPS